MPNTDAARAKTLANIERALRGLADRREEWVKRLPISKGVDERRFIDVQADGHLARTIVEGGGLFAEAFSLGACAGIASEPSVKEALSEADRVWTAGRWETGGLNSDWRDTQVFQAVRGVLVKARTLIRTDNEADAIRAFANLMADADKGGTAEAAAGNNSEACIVAAVAQLMEKTKRAKRKANRAAHRPADTDAKADAKIADAWLSGRNIGEYRAYRDLADVLNRDRTEVKEALDRDRHRRPDAWATAKRKPRRKR